jgi:hypothetical protein
MSSMTVRTITCSVALLIAAIVAAAGCGSPNSTASYNPEESVHPPDWLPAGHMVAAGENADTCRQCHGRDLVSGGISKIGCTGCHIGGPLAVHPATFNGLPWLEGGHGQYAAVDGTAACKNIWCHGNNLQGVAQSGPSCRECHDFP